MILTHAHRAVRQRELLSQLGMDIWVQRGSRVVSHDEFINCLNEQQEDHSSNLVGDDHTANIEKVAENTLNDNKAGYVFDSTSLSHETHNSTYENSETQASVTQVDSDSYDATERGLRVDTAFDESATNHKSTQQEVVSQNTATNNNTEISVNFDLYALRYKNHVILCDAEHMKTEQQAALWQNIQTALQAEVETLRFPLSEKLATDSESAQASILGWLYRMVQAQPQIQAEESAHVILLGDMPACFPRRDGYKTLGSLAMMLEQPLQKKLLWEAIK